MQAANTCRSMLSAPRRSWADFRSLKVREAAVFDPSISAWAVNSAIRSVRKVAFSYISNARPVILNPRRQVQRMTMPNLRRMDESLKNHILVPFLSADDALRECQQL